jgi:hypothetical protein
MIACVRRSYWNIRPLGLRDHCLARNRTGLGRPPLGIMTANPDGDDSMREFVSDTTATKHSATAASIIVPASGYYNMTVVSVAHRNTRQSHQHQRPMLEYCYDPRHWTTTPTMNRTRQSTPVFVSEQPIGEATMTTPPPPFKPTTIKTQVIYCGSSLRGCDSHGRRDCTCQIRIRANLGRANSRQVALLLPITHCRFCRGWCTRVDVLYILYNSIREMRS